MHFPKAILALLSLMLVATYSYSQTCCSGGVPISGNLGLPPGSSGTWQMSLNYDFNVLKTLKEGENVLDDQSRERITQSIIYQTGYSITERLSADLFVSYVKQERTIRQFGNTDYVTTNGLGDAAMLIKYALSNPGTSKVLITVAAGPKFPTGKSDLRRDDGIPLNADLQPGSGSWDGVFWANGIYKFSFRPTFNVGTTLIYSYKGKNNDYLGGQTYQFGNELQALIAFNDNFLLGKKTLDTSVFFRYRRALQDRFNELTMPNTGGEWLFIAPSLAYNFTQKLALTTNIEFPLYSRVDGTQLSPTYRVNIGVFVKINKKNELLKL